jgi:hypothetical protein
MCRKEALEMPGTHARLAETCVAEARALVTAPPVIEARISEALWWKDERRAAR